MSKKLDEMHERMEVLAKRFAATIRPNLNALFDLLVVSTAHLRMVRDRSRDEDAQALFIECYAVAYAARAGLDAWLRQADGLLEAGETPAGPVDGHA